MEFLKQTSNAQNANYSIAIEQNGECRTLGAQIVNLIGASATAISELETAVGKLFGPMPTEAEKQGEPHSVGEALDVLERRLAKLTELAFRVNARL